MSKQTDFWMTVVAVLIFATMIAGVLAMRLWFAGGDWTCIMSADPALCAAVNRR